MSEDEGHERSSAKAELRELRALLNEWDPIGVYDPELDFPADEYDCMQGPLLSRLRRGESADEIADLLLIELREHFSVPPAPGQPDAFARKLVTWYSGLTH